MLTLLKAAVDQIEAGADLTRNLGRHFGRPEPVELLERARRFLQELGLEHAARKLDWNEATADWRPLPADGLVKGLCVDLQTAMFGILFDGSGDAVVFPAAGLDTQFIGKRNILTVGPYESTHNLHLNKHAEDLVDSDLNIAKRPRALLLKGIQTILTADGLVELTRLVDARRVVVCGTAKPRRGNEVGYSLRLPPPDSPDV